ncbi:2-succinylbenzoate--CoA ligase [Defluviimonas aquaemixtae]|uniref:2-succinylbenzoate--CoA ligase n=1 Tax=Albidovulum aquaemixtae TaxID=1542388 RepID=A0A2R8BLM0_9RHOB|nr:fatty acid--CoA ligase family protein [Defluviimonas aquaemixtae]SPH24276.1 2-succinylbenzoate--CoA ligase [Defluviimonas aquaemixtae]
MTALVDQIAAPEIVGAGHKLVTRDALQAYTASRRVAETACVALSFNDPLLLVRALAALDGQVEAMLLLSGVLDRESTVKLMAQVGCDMLLTDRSELNGFDNALGFDLAIAEGRGAAGRTTKWLMTTSGTTGLPKVIPHTLQSLARSVYRFAPADAPTWGLLYDPTRFAGLQVTLQALIGGGRLVIANTHKPLAEQIQELINHGCTHLSATPTLWRRILMVPDHRKLQLKQVTLGGEIADQATLDALRAAFPDARVTHIYASTEAGVGFSVNDGKAGFPAAYLRVAPGGMKLKIVDNILWLRPPHTPPPNSPGIEVDADGFVRSGDLIAAETDRLLFLGRENGLINVGGVKVYPETVENVVKDIPGVALAQVTAKKSPITGTLVVAEVLLEASADPACVKQAILESCRAKLVREAVPAIVRFVQGFETNSAGKLVRNGGTPE